MTTRRDHCLVRAALPALLGLLGLLGSSSSALAQGAPPPPPAPSTPAAAPAAEAAPEEAPPSGQRKTALAARLVLKVIQPEEVRQGIIAELTELGGYPTLVTDNQLSLKLPPEHLSAVLGRIGERGLVLEKSLSREDLTESIAKLQGRLKSKQQIFGKLQSFFDGSNLKATLEIERSMRTLVEEMESVKGQLRVNEERARWATITISFRFPERRRVRYVRSPFPWLNTVELGSFLHRFDWGS